MSYQYETEQDYLDAQFEDLLLYFRLGLHLGLRPQCDGPVRRYRLVSVEHQDLAGSGHHLQRLDRGQVVVAHRIHDGHPVQVVLVVGLRFVSDVVAPARMGLPLHRCTYCLAAEAPENLVGLALLALPALAAGWRVAARWLGPTEGPSVARLERALDGAALFGALGSLLFFTGEWLVS